MNKVEKSPQPSACEPTTVLLPGNCGTTNFLRFPSLNKRRSFKQLSHRCQGREMKSNHDSSVRTTTLKAIATSSDDEPHIAECYQATKTAAELPYNINSDG